MGAYRITEGAYRITEKDIQGLEPLAVGYKMFLHDWTARADGYDYKDENGEVIGTIHKVDGDIKECQWGLHFSKKPQDCFNFYECVQWNKFAKVEAYGRCIDSENGEKSIAQIIKIVRVYTFNEFIQLIQKFCQNSINSSDGVNKSHCIGWSCGINSSGGVNSSDSVSWSHGVNWSCGITASDSVDKSNGVSKSSGINESNGVNSAHGINMSSGINWSSGINSSCGINSSSDVNSSDSVSWSHGVDESFGVNLSYGVSQSNGVNLSYGVLKCEGISHAIFCYNKSGSFYLFNKHCTKERFNEVYDKLLRSFDWYPCFNNARELRGNLEWYETNIPAIAKVSNEVAWSFMPEDMKAYIQSLPEYDDKLFKRITGKIEE